MLVACLPLLVALLVGLPSTVTTQTLDHQQLDINALGTNPASPGDFGVKHLSKDATSSVESSPEFEDLTLSNYFNLENFIVLKPHSFDDKVEYGTHLNPGSPSRVQRSFSFPKLSENADNSSFPCPDPITIAPCNCSTVNTELNLDCSDVASLDQLAEVFRQDFPVKQFNTLQIYDNKNIQYLTDVFNGVSFKDIQLTFLPNLTEISTFAFFDSIDFLENLVIYDTSLNENTFPFSTLGEFTKLASLTISMCNFEFWPVFASSSVKSIYFYQDSISTLSRGEKEGHCTILKGFHTYIHSYSQM